MKKKLFLSILLTTYYILLATSLPVYAATSPNGNCGSGFIDTAIGCIPITDFTSFAGWILKWGIGIGGGVAFILIIIASFMIMTSQGNPQKQKAGSELLTSAITGLLMLVFGVAILGYISGNKFLGLIP